MVHTDEILATFALVVPCAVVGVAIFSWISLLIGQWRFNRFVRDMDRRHAAFQEESRIRQQEFRRRNGLP